MATSRASRLGAACSEEIDDKTPLRRDTTPSKLHGVTCNGGAGGRVAARDGRAGLDSAGESLRHRDTVLHIDESVTPSVKHARREASSCTAIIVHPTMPNGIRSILDIKYAPIRVVSGIAGIHCPFVIAQSWRPGHTDVGAVVWHSSLVLAQYLSVCVSRSSMCGSTVIELGCGAGAVGAMAAATLGAHVVATDLPDVVDLAERNVRRNFRLADRSENWRRPTVVRARGRDTFAPMSVADGVLETGTLQLVPYRWGEVSDVEAAADWVIGADVVYEPMVHHALVGAIKKLCQDKTTCLLAFKSRLPDCESRLLNVLLPAAGFDVDVQRVPNMPALATLPLGEAELHWLCIAIVRRHRAA